MDRETRLKLMEMAARMTTGIAAKYTPTSTGADVALTAFDSVLEGLEKRFNDFAEKDSTR